MKHIVPTILFVVILGSSAFAERIAKLNVCVLTKGADGHTIHKWHVGFPGKPLMHGEFSVPGGGRIRFDAGSMFDPGVHTPVAGLC